MDTAYSSSVPANRRPWWQRILVGQSPIITILRALAWVVLLLLLFRFVALPIRVSGISMEPAFQENSLHFVNKLAYRFSSPQRGDVVAVRFSGDSVFLLKRVVALPGEHVVLRNGQLYIDGEPVQEPYLHPDQAPWNYQRQLEENEYFVIGDNRSMDQDDHYWGVADRDRIAGKILY